MHGIMSLTRYFIWHGLDMDFAWLRGCDLTVILYSHSYFFHEQVADPKNIIHFFPRCTTVNERGRVRENYSQGQRNRQSIQSGDINGTGQSEDIQSKTSTGKTTFTRVFENKTTGHRRGNRHR